ncbi:UDP-N-acetylmuramoyl-L-alanyl-D-glutamate--2,6-diaminopimelate ligase [Sediminicoccus sp. KRV36]|uniref:UDP-N-acetylmuramoyl-L-alanyl-D-glutamate--2, 6-diaminopimelate ligase n=1 Tax=Sediminicoccus sp. KRV36 TaxID=3133721 RepID=UPI0020106DFD|nr:UDP-N-acetylmuramoyl-L-alanyl-D-glutamate--2,6-diaminopimelate ligase [Sediminicoccus rosea]UPY38194.1 UDP-N-acetylmuramoyl-L-alanyl-D-glutamate--2,6-diaminopimelate ligase [Sediminicoccus rosea]
MRCDDILPLFPGLSAEGFPDILGVTADSRAVRPGFLFAALPGARADGMRFVADAVAAGAAAILAPEGADWPAEAPQRPFLRTADPRRALALIAAAFHGAQPERVAAITGTNGKTSTADFLRQILGERAASLGTLGLIAAGFPRGESLTTPDPVALHATLAALQRAGINDLALEASSHGLDQRRLDGVRLAAAAFTNLTRDHLDYHGDMAAYRAAKLRLFDTLLPPGAPAVIQTEMEAPTLEALRGIIARRGLRGIEVGEAGSDLRLISQRVLPAGQVIEVDAFGQRAEIPLAVPGRFQADNALVASGLAVGMGRPVPQVLDALARLAPVRGRMELAATLAHGAAIYVDYAHTPDALTRLLAALRPHVGSGGRLHVLFGAGGDRDPGKRPLMGAAAAAGADQLWVTDDNPRSEDPAAIRAAILAAAPGARDAGERAAAIALALDALRPGDVLAVAGKGHESGQTIAGVTTPFDDADMVRRLAGVRP